MSKGSQSSQAYMCSENHCIQIFSWSLEFIRLIGTDGSRVGQLSRPQALAVDSKGHLYITDVETIEFRFCIHEFEFSHKGNGRLRTRSCAPY